MKATLLAATVILAGTVTAHAEDIQCRTNTVACCDFASPSRPVKPVPPAFGVHIWPSALVRDPGTVQKLILLRPRHLRFAFEPHWRRQPALSPDMTDDAIDLRVATAFGLDPHVPEYLRMMVHVKEATGALFHLVVWEPPPMPGEPDFTKPGTRKWRTLESEHVVLAARFHVANLKHLQKIGLPMDAMEVTNEPDGSWNIKIAPRDYLALVREIRREASRRGVNLPKVYGPGASRVEALRDYFRETVTAREIIDSVDVLSVHVWDDKAGKDRFVQLGELFADLERIGRRPELAVTEYALARPILHDKSDRMNAGKRLPDSVAHAPTYPAASMRDLLRLYGARIGTVIYWEFQDQDWGAGLYGLLDTRGMPKSIFTSYRALADRMWDFGPTAIDSSSDGRAARIRGARGSYAALSNPDSETMDVVMVSGNLDTGRTLQRCAAADGRQGVRIPPGGTVLLRVAAP